MKLNDIFNIDKYNEAYDFVIKNNYTIKEIEKDSNGERQFKIVEIPPLTEEARLELLRSNRESDCFTIINRGELWYNKLTENQKQELSEWYQKWLDVTEETNKDENGNYIIPEKPNWLV